MPSPADGAPDPDLHAAVEDHAEGRRGALLARLQREDGHRALELHAQLEPASVLSIRDTHWGVLYFLFCTRYSY